MPNFDVRLFQITDHTNASRYSLKVYNMLWFLSMLLLLLLIWIHMQLRLLSWDNVQGWPLQQGLAAAVLLYHADNRDWWLCWLVSKSLQQWWWLQWLLLLEHLPRETLCCYHGFWKLQDLFLYDREGCKLFRLKTAFWICGWTSGEMDLACYKLSYQFKL